ncbi:SusC/RagA family TonB-linked outer membrane protein [Pedobacter yulinensis]|uniref:SusC/RagA family TonB-linked outer membrane protein n=1 Tax=Pedobacter yulinensis TaxID=2126353 RepID=A0A2T3HNA4_9SPHI|nr:TonB-dependent receptor [Pedobacter yulinensis]PST83925.1 SusC/RagA family TonB-linked outer membrane protein [Pedobacter yulinensis]
MKKLHVHDSHAPDGTLKTKLIRMMKIMTALMWLGLMSAYAGSNAQIRMNIDLTGGNLPELFQKIQKQSNYLIVYNDEVMKLNKEKEINLKLQDKTVDEILRTALRGTNLTHLVSGRQILILTKERLAKMQDTLLTIRGRVFDTHEPPAALPGVSIRVKGTMRGTTTDADGYFTIQAKKDEVLAFSMVSYTGFEHTVVKADRSLNVSLKENVSALNEVVVVGLNEQQKKHIASSLSTLNVKSNIEGKPITTLSQSLQGGVTGINVTQGSGLPGGDAATIKIRGISTLGNSNPLVLVDGIPMDMNHIDPVTVESVTVLKDAAAAASYGSRGANGVIVVTTKRGVAGKMSIIYDGYYGVQQATALPQTVDAPTYMRMYNEASFNNNPTNTLPFTQEQIDNTRNGMDPIANPALAFANTNWLDMLIDDAAPISSNSLSLSGGSNVARFALTGNYTSQKGIIPLSNMRRYNIRANTTISLSEKFQVNLDFLAIRRNTQQPNRPSASGNSGNRILEDMYRVPPTIVPKYPEKGGRLFYGQYLDVVNPLAYAEAGGTRSLEAGQTSINLQPKWEIMKGLNFRGQFSFRLNSDVNRDVRENFNHFDYYTGNLLRTWALQRANTMGRTTYYYVGSTLDYTLSKNNHRIFALAGYSQEETNSGAFEVFSMVSAYAKLNYSYKDRYLLEGTVRTDGSSRFGPGKKFGVFPSVALGWNLHNENFLSESKVINNFKLRASYGKLGNDNIGLYRYQTLINNGSGVETTYGNPDITWESVNMLDIGIDLGLFKNNKVEFTFDFYDKRTNDIILTPELPMVGGFESEVPVNAGVVSNKGWEASINYNEKIGEKFSLSFRPGVTYNKNEVLQLQGRSIVTATTITQVGSAVNSVYGYRSNGLLQQNDFDANGQPRIPVLPNSRPGDIRYVDLNGDNVIGAEDQGWIGNGVPELTYFANLRLAYGGFDLEALFQGVGKSDATLFGMFAQPLDFSADGGVPTTYYADNYWTPQRTDARFPRLSVAPANNKVSSDFWFQNGAYVRVKFLQLGYNFRAALARKLGVEGVRAYLNAQNPFTFTSVKITDPESRGYQWTYGLVKMYTVGLNVKF